MHTLEGEEDKEREVVLFLRGVLNLGEEAEVVVRPCERSNVKRAADDIFSVEQDTRRL